jgi:dTMP kinase
MHTSPATFIAIEGMDGSGKTTLVRELTRVMKGMPVIFTHEPGGTPLAGAIRNILLDGNLSGGADSKTQLLGFFYARSDHIRMIRSLRTMGQTVITDRFDGSTFAYQVYGESRTPEEQKGLEHFFWTLRKSVVNAEHAPTLYLYLDLPPEIAQVRRGADQSQAMNHYDSKPIDFYRRQHEGYKVFFRDIAEWHQSEVAFIDATLSPDDIFEETLRIIHNHIRSETTT